jgi:hypothetical protein
VNAGKPWRHGSRLTDDDRVRLNAITDDEASRLDPCSDEHEYVWGFRADRLGERHRLRLGSAAREAWHEQLAAGGHVMSWSLGDLGPDTAPQVRR